MKKVAKTTYLQLRVSPREKELIRQRAQGLNMDMSEWVLSQVLPVGQNQLFVLVEKLAKSTRSSYVLAEISDFLFSLEAHELELAIKDNALQKLSQFWQNYLAAMIEHVCALKSVSCPQWLNDIVVNPEPYFATDLMSVRLHLLLNALPAFKKRNLFVDASVGARV